MISFSLKTLCEFANYTLSGEDKVINLVSSDSRKAEGALFVPLIGERFDGHDFIEKAVAAGAVAVLSQKKLSKDLEAKVSVVYCSDTLKALGYLGYLVRRQCRAKIASLTGSCGKTTVKEFTHSILSQCGKSMCTEGNFNNDVGVPLTLLRLDNSYDYAVVEQGGSHLFDIAHTCEFIKADTAVISNVGSAHIEGFGSLDGVYHGKSEILDDVLSRGGYAAVPSDSPYIARWRSDFAASFKDGHLLSYGSFPQDFVQFSSVVSSQSGIEFDLRVKELTKRVKLNVLGAHNASNAAAAAALALLTGADTDSVFSGLEKTSTLKGRLCIKSYNKFDLIDDAYNASFNAVIAAIDTLSAFNGHRVMIFGDMGELGQDAVKLHEMVG
ncbi:MAG: UDP-N-acetylmuramoyl-tripeptide--D-alanyl-D-alanine ligase, partial [Succinivibrio sp.]